MDSHYEEEDQIPGGGNSDPLLVDHTTITDLKRVIITKTRHERAGWVGDDITTHVSGPMDLLSLVGILELAKAQLLQGGIPEWKDVYSSGALYVGTLNEDEEESFAEAVEREEGSLPLRDAVVRVLLEAQDRSRDEGEGLIRGIDPENLDDKAYARLETALMDRILSRHQTLLVSGSRSIRSLPLAARRELDTAMEREMNIILGDAPGVDSLVQEYLKRKGYERVLVHYALFSGGGRPRNTNGFPQKGVEGNYSDRDRYMCSIASRGLAIWDGKSKGTRENIHRVEHTTTIRV